MVRDSLPPDLQPHEFDLARLIRDALLRYIALYGHVRATISSLRGERNDIHDCMTSVAKERFTYAVHGHRFVVVVGRYIIRLKKFSERLETSNNPTQASMNFENQVVGYLPGLEPINLNLGYVPDPIDPRNSSIWMTQPGADGWAYRMREDAAAGELPKLPATDPNEGGKKTRVTPKRVKKTQDGQTPDKE